MKTLVLALLFAASPAFAVCGGISDSCAFAGASGPGACMSQSGCSWEATSNSCTGFAPSCSSLGDESSCVDVSGCSWTPDGAPRLAVQSQQDLVCQ